jgi:hypothetical protein
MMQKIVGENGPRLTQHGRYDVALWRVRVNKQTHAARDARCFLVDLTQSAAPLPLQARLPWWRHTRPQKHAQELLQTVRTLSAATAERVHLWLCCSGV